MIVSEIGEFSTPGMVSPGDADLLALTGQASYRWDVARDALEWSSNSAKVLGVEDVSCISTGYRLDRLITGSHGPDRRRAIEAIKSGTPTFFHCIYSLAERPDARGIWLEDCGVAYPDETGQPRIAIGVVRRIREVAAGLAGDRPGAGTGDRHYLEQMIEQAVAECRRDGFEAALFIVEIGGLQLTNDLYGFSAGDELLMRSATTLAKFVGRGDSLVRISGAKFALIKRDCPACETYGLARKLLGRLKSEVRRTGFGPVSLQARIGAVRMPCELSDTNEIIAAAVSACDRAGRESGPEVHVFDNRPEIRAKRYKDAKLAATVANSVGSGLLELAFQPIVHSGTGKIAFHEALVRMGACRDSVIRAEKFVPVAEKLGLIERVDAFALRRSVELLQRHGDARISINVSNETVENADWLSALARLVDNRTGIAERLVVEITESRAASDLKETYKFVSIVKSLGCQVAIDDFGAGYTSFSNLKALPIDIIKIDGSFASNIETDPHNGIFIRSLLALAQAFDVKTVVEWIEDEQTAKTLADWGVHYLQGHCFGAASLDLPWTEDAGMQQENVRLAG